MAPSCPAGKIRRRSYTRKDGVHVRSTCVKDMGKPGKTPSSKKVLPTPRPGGLSVYGYDDVKSKTELARHRALARGVRDVGYLTIARRLNLVANYNKNTSPAIHRKMRADLTWLREKYGN